jgi:hypothetical protein
MDRDRPHGGTSSENLHASTQHGSKLRQGSLASNNRCNVSQNMHMRLTVSLPQGFNVQEALAQLVLRLF